MGADGESTQRGKGGRPPGVPNRDKAELRALLQERVHEFTELRARQDAEQGIPPQDAQQIVDDYDPVVALALVAVDRRTTLDQRIRCNSEVAQYVRPKLKSVEMSLEPDTAETLAQREQLSSQLIGILTSSASARKRESKAAKNKPTEPPEK